MNTDNRTDDELNCIICRWEGKHKPTLLMPNYCRYLNAVHEAEKKLLGDIGNTWDRYCDRLGGSLYHCAHAAARQRAEALVRVIEESKK